ncbi:PLC-like phosphodiesterase [Zychaea mexicana]|uniref:PLC-like phosphodiesterase n=1 Tax=Zychaea mexicana TaxID=64656 RepID=UPI0022FDCCDF|nr:PLC-like phosphodiesterase [Zychaea mexicana]KAI9497071.1 PLC-like phosphodiesterase [Zychaea mexicana]
MTIDSSIPSKYREIQDLPGVIAHRGYSGKYPENTMLSYEKGVEAKATALEGDIRLTKDGEIIMMHDMKLNRTTTGHGKIGEVNYHGYIDGLETKSDPPQPIPLFRDVVKLMLRQDVIDRNMYMIIDIKFDNPIEIMEAVHKLLKTEFGDHMDTLARQLVIGIWHVDFLPEAQKIGFPICFIGLSLAAARKHFLHTADYLSIPFAALADADGHAFLKEARSLNKKVITWTINEVEQMHECLALGVDGVVGDHVELMIKNLWENIEGMSPEEYEKYIESSTYLGSSRRRMYFYLLKNAMHYASRGYIGM